MFHFLSWKVCMCEERLQQIKPTAVRDICFSRSRLYRQWDWVDRNCLAFPSLCNPLWQKRTGERMMFWLAVEGRCFLVCYSNFCPPFFRLAAQAQNLKKAEGPRKLYVGSLHYNISENMLKPIFEAFGQVQFFNQPHLYVSATWLWIFEIMPQIKYNQICILEINTHTILEVTKFANMKLWNMVGSLDINFLNVC